ncbi:MAG: hypothetical protein IT518_20305 [Burkholderiales bacterium]|nr:hypothetical protein [Burkholderiales bacterium]
MSMKSAANATADRFPVLIQRSTSQLAVRLVVLAQGLWNILAILFTQSEGAVRFALVVNTCFAAVVFLQVELRKLLDLFGPDLKAAAGQPPAAGTQ